MRLYKLRSLAVLALAASVFVVGPAQAQTIEPTANADERIVFLVRHAEKCLAEGNDPALTSAGQQRAVDLARVLADVPITAIYSTPFQRTKLTAEPVATLHGVDVTVTPTRPGFLDDLATTLRNADDRYSLVSGHSNTTPALVNRLAGTDLANLTEDIYDKLYIVTLGADGSTSVLTLRFGAESSSTPNC